MLRLPGVRMRGLLDRVDTLLTSDGDPQVVANCLYVLQQVRRASAGRSEGQGRPGEAVAARPRCSRPVPPCSAGNSLRVLRDAMHRLKWPHISMLAHPTAGWHAGGPCDATACHLPAQPHPLFQVRGLQRVQKGTQRWQKEMKRSLWAACSRLAAIEPAE